MLNFAGAGVCLGLYFFYPSETKSAPTYDAKPISASHFTPLTLTSSEVSGHDTKMLTLTVPLHMRPPKDTPGIRPIWSIFIKDDDIQVERPYTPLEGIDDEGRMKFWIKKYDKGEVGRWLHSKKVGDSIEIRGPLTTWSYEGSVWDEVVMVCRACPDSGSR